MEQIFLQIRAMVSGYDELNHCTELIDEWDEQLQIFPLKSSKKVFASFRFE